MPKHRAITAIAAIPVAAAAVWIANDYYSPQTSIASYTAFLKLNYIAQPILATILALLVATAIAAFTRPPPVSRRLILALIAVLYLSSAGLERVVRLQKPPDAYTYIQAAQQILAGCSPLEANWEHPPLAKLIMAISMKAVSHPYLAAALPCTTLSLAAVLAVEKLAKESGADPKLAALLLALNPIYFLYTTTPLLDAYATPLAIIGYTLSLSPSPAHKLAAGATLGLAAACKWTALPTLLAAALYTLIQEKKPAKAALIATAATTAYTLTYLPYTTPHTIIQHHKKMLAYMLTLHAAKHPGEGLIALAGLYKLKEPPHPNPIPHFLGQHQFPPQPYPKGIDLTLITWRPGSPLTSPILPILLARHIYKKRKTPASLYTATHIPYYIMLSPTAKWYQLPLTPIEAILTATLIHDISPHTAKALTTAYIIQFIANLAL